MLTRNYILITAGLLCRISFSIAQETGWEFPPIKNTEAVIPAEFKDEPIVILKDVATFNFRDYSAKTLHRTVLLKIVWSEGLKTFNSVTLPESFDHAENKELWQQGRRSHIKVPFIKTREIKNFMARIIKANNEVVNVQPEIKYKTVRWIKSTGEFVNDEVKNYEFKQLETGDLLEYSYTVDYKPNYGNDIMYLSSEFPKVKVDYTFEYYILPQNKNAKFVLTQHIPDSCIRYTKTINKKEPAFITENIVLENVPKVNYFIHAMSSKQLPFVYFNMNYSIRMFNNRAFSVANIPDFNWTNVLLSNKKEFDWYTKFPNDIKKFVSSFPVFDNDSSNRNFIKAIIDTLNSFKYYSANTLFYNESQLYNLWSTQHLFKRRISEINMLHVYESILNDKNIFYYITNVQDKRLGENNPLIRNRAYENIILAIPDKGAYTYFVPRYNGLKYLLNELPFYYQGAIAALFPVNYVKLNGDTMGNHFRFIRTYSASEEENVRVENATIKINIDSAVSYLSIRERLAGQFSTLLRPYYLNDLIDSTVNPIYFKTCVDKPYSLQHKIKLKSKSEIFPFAFVFDCSEKIVFLNKGEINTQNWFSFLFNRTLISEKPTHDFYCDFEFTDNYNYEFQFNSPVNIMNSEDFEKTLNNGYFELNSKLIKQDQSYLLSIMVKVKKNKLPKEDAGKLMEFVDALDSLNNANYTIPGNLNGNS